MSDRPGKGLEATETAHVTLQLGGEKQKNTRTPLCKSCHSPNNWQKEQKKLPPLIPLPQEKIQSRLTTGCILKLACSTQKKKKSLFNRMK